MSRAAWFTGSTAEITEQLTGYIDAGATWISMCDILPMVRPIEEAPAAMARSFDLARRLKTYAAKSRTAAAAIPDSRGR
jgi:phthiodiolone/phenolphthiodiolone dimycocerosates ketoreductase